MKTNYLPDYYQHHVISEQQQSQPDMMSTKVGAMFPAPLSAENIVCTDEHGNRHYQEL